MTRAALKRLEELSRSLAREAASLDPDGPALPAGPDAATAMVAPIEAVRIAEALIFAAPQPMKEEDLAARLPRDSDVAAILAELVATYAGRGINLVRVAGGWAFRSASDVAYALAGEAGPPQKLSRAAMEVLSIIAYHQPATRAEIEDIRGVTTSKGTIDILLESGWIRLRGRRRAPGRPVTFGTTPAFLAHFGLDAISDLPGLEELKGLGFLEGRIPTDLTLAIPSDSETLGPDEEPLEADMLSVTPFGPADEEDESSEPDPGREPEIG